MLTKCLLWLISNVGQIILLNDICALAVWCTMHACRQTNRVRSLFRLCASIFLVLSFFYQYHESLCTNSFDLWYAGSLGSQWLPKVTKCKWFYLIKHALDKKISPPHNQNQLFNIQAIPKYLEKCKFLPKLNNELPDERNSTYKERFTSLENLVLIMVCRKTHFFLPTFLWNSLIVFSNVIITAQWNLWLSLCVSWFWMLISPIMTLFWYQGRPPGLDITQTEPSIQFYLHNRYQILASMTQRDEWRLKFITLLEKFIKNKEKMLEK